MRGPTRWLRAVLSLLVLLFGLGCLNYTKGPGIEHHREVARQRNLPPPERPIFYGGVVATVLGAAAFGFVFGRRSSA